MKRRLIIAALVVIVAGAGLWWFLKHSGAKESETKPTAQVEVVALKVESITETLEAFGVVESAPGAELVSSAPFDCVVAAVEVAAGDQVAAGDVLLQIAPSPDSKLVLDAARSALIVAEKGLQAAQERFELKLGTNQDLAVARQAETDARAKVASLEARGMGSDGRIRAKAAGVVSKLEVTTGSLVTLGAPLVSVASAQHLEAHLSVEGAARALLAKNQSVKMTSSDNPAPVPIEAHVRTVGAALNATAGSLDVRVAFPAAAPLLLGEHVRALIEVKKQNDALVVPRSAVLPDEDAQVLFTVKDGKAVRHEVTPGIESGERLAVEGKGLAAGDLVVVTGNYELTDGMAVQTAKPADKAEEAGKAAPADSKAAAGAEKDP